MNKIFLKSLIISGIMGALLILSQTEIKAGELLFYPLREGKISSVFHDPHRQRIHQGIDIVAPIGSPIYAAGDGTVTYAGNAGAYGNLIKIRHDNGLITVYAHASKIMSNQGQIVKTGDLIALVGRSGNATGPHLHFEIRKNKIFLNPLHYVKPEVNAYQIASQLRNSSSYQVAQTPNINYDDNFPDKTTFNKQEFYFRPSVLYIDKQYLQSRNALGTINKDNILMEISGNYYFNINKNQPIYGIDLSLGYQFKAHERFAIIPVTTFGYTALNNQNGTSDYQIPFHLGLRALLKFNFNQNWAINGEVSYSYLNLSTNNFLFDLQYKGLLGLGAGISFSIM